MPIRAIYKYIIFKYRFFNFQFSTSRGKFLIKISNKTHVSKLIYFQDEMAHLFFLQKKELKSYSIDHLHNNKRILLSLLSIIYITDTLHETVHDII